MIRPGLLLLALAAALPATANEKAAPDWTIDRMVANGAASAAEREAFVKSFSDSCVAENQAVAARLGKDDLATYCACTAGKSTSVITSGEIAWMAANNNALPPSAVDKLQALAKDCGDFLIERRAGQ